MSKPLSAALGSWRGIKWLLVPPVQSPSSSRCQSGAKGTRWKYKWSPLLECHADNEPLHGVSYSNFKSHSGLKVTLAKFFSFWSLPARTAMIFSWTVAPCQSSDLTCTLFSGDFFLPCFNLCCSKSPVKHIPHWHTSPGRPPCSLLCLPCRNPWRCDNLLLVLQMRDKSTFDGIFFLFKTLTLLIIICSHSKYRERMH